MRTVCNVDNGVNVVFLTLPINPNSDRDGPWLSMREEAQLYYIYLLIIYVYICSLSHKLHTYLIFNPNKGMSHNASLDSWRPNPIKPFYWILVIYLVQASRPSHI